MSTFIKELKNAYKGLILEQTPEEMGAPAPAAPPVPAAPIPQGPVAPSLPSVEKTTETPSTRSASEAFLIGMIAKALLIDIDEDDKYKVMKYLKSLNNKEEEAAKIEENLVNILNGYDYQNIDEFFKGSDNLVVPKKNRKVVKFLNKVMSNYIDTESK